MTTPNSEQAFKDRIYPALINLHESKHIENCFCTTEISGAYKFILEANQKAVTAAEVALLKKVINHENHPPLLGPCPGYCIERAIDAELRQRGAA